MCAHTNPERRLDYTTLRRSFTHMLPLPLTHAGLLLLLTRPHRLPSLPSLEPSSPAFPLSLEQKQQKRKRTGTSASPVRRNGVVCLRYRLFLPPPPTHNPFSPSTPCLTYSCFSLSLSLFPLPPPPTVLSQWRLGVRQHREAVVMVTGLLSVLCPSGIPDPESSSIVFT